ncbi:MAG: hypothetical protein INR73_25965 [Williamsia sp.]|nr:hypothetical protein [Williamsia sp.]
MKKILSATILLTALFLGSGCIKDADTQTNDSCDKLPHSNAPAGLVGNWSSGFASYLQLVDIYTGRTTGSAWTSGKLFKITSNGRNAEFYYTAQTQYMQAATKATGSISFDAGSTAQAGSFTFSACGGHYKGWGTTSVDRDATSEELRSSLTRKYYYKVDGQWLRIEPGGPVNDYSSSFRIVN